MRTNSPLPALFGSFKGLVTIPAALSYEGGASANAGMAEFEEKLLLISNFMIDP